MVKRLKTKASLSQLHILWIIKIDKILDFLLFFFNTFFLTLYDNFFPQFQPNIAINGKKSLKYLTLWQFCWIFFLTIYLYEDYFPNFNQILLKRVKKKSLKKFSFEGRIFWGMTLLVLLSCSCIQKQNIIYSPTKHNIWSTSILLKKKAACFTLHWLLLILLLRIIK